MIEQDIFNQLKSLVAGRMYPMSAPEDTVTPYIVFQNIHNAPENTLNGVSINNTHMQVDCYGKTATEVYALRDAVLASMAASSLVNVQKSNQDAYEAEVKLYRVIIDFSIWQ